MRGKQQHLPDGGSVDIANRRPDGGADDVAHSRPAGIHYPNGITVKVAHLCPDRSTIEVPLDFPNVISVETNRQCSGPDQDNKIGKQVQDWIQIEKGEEKFEINGEEHEINGERYEIDGGKFETNGENREIDGKEWEGKIEKGGEKFEIDGGNYEINGEEHKINGGNYQINGENHGIDREKYEINEEKYEINEGDEKVEISISMQVIALQVIACNIYEKTWCTCLCVLSREVSKK